MMTSRLYHVQNQSGTNTVTSYWAAKHFTGGDGLLIELGSIHGQGRTQGRVKRGVEGIDGLIWWLGFRLFKLFRIR
jgi:hypothetical protein